MVFDAILIKQTKYTFSEINLPSSKTTFIGNVTMYMVAGRQFGRTKHGGEFTALYKIKLVSF